MCPHSTPDSVVGMAPDSVSGATEVPHLGPPPERLDVDVPTARRLVSRQFPQWSTLSVEPVPEPGWDNYTFRLGEDMLVRLPSAAEYALAVEKEQRWLPELAPHLPVPIPSVIGLGTPDVGYPFTWSVYEWLDGSAATRADLADPVAFAEQLADFLVALRGVDAAQGPQPGIHNWFRGETLLTYDATTRRSLGELTSRVDTQLAAEVWDAALAATWDGDDVWFHGDLAQGNLLLREGHLAAVIDFGTCGVGDPSCDLAVAHTLLVEPGRQAFKERLRADDASWARGRGWALWKTLSGLAAAVADEDEEDTAELLRVLSELFTDHTTMP